MKWYDPRTWFARNPPVLQPYLPLSPRQQAVVERLDNERRQRVLMESTAYTPPFDLVNPWRPFYDGMKLIFPLFPARFDYRYSQNYIFLTQTQLDLFRVYGRWLYETNPIAQGVVNCLADYIIATGFKYNVSARRHVSPNKSLIKKANLFLEDFFNKNEWWMYERELFIRKKRDGDAFLEFFPQGDGITKVLVIEPEQIRNITEHGPEWQFGIKADADDHTDLQAYRVWVSPEEQDGREVPADEMIFFKNHCDRNIRRGLSDFFNVQDILESTVKLVRAGREGQIVQQSIAYIREWELADRNALQDLQATDTDYQVPVYTTNSSNRLENVHTIQPGEVIDVMQGCKFLPPPMGNTENAKTMAIASVNLAASKWRVPTWVLSGDINVNFAAALVAESPMTKACEYDQHWHNKMYCKVATRALEIGVQQGLLPDDTLEQVEVTAEGVPVAARNLLQETQINEILARNRLMSRRTWAARENLDYDAEQDAMREEEPVPVADSDAKPSPTPGAEYQREVGK